MQHWTLTDDFQLLQFMCATLEQKLSRISFALPVEAYVNIVITCGEASTVLTATDLDSGKGEFRSPTESTLLNRSPINLLQVIKSVTLQTFQIWCKSTHRELLGKRAKYFIYVYLFLLTPPQVRPVDRF